MLYRFLAEMVQVMHGVLVFVILFGAFFPVLFWVHGLALIGTALSWIIWRRCVLVDLEYYFRAKYGVVRPSHSHFLSYVGYQLLGDRVPRESIIFMLGIVFLVVSLLCWLVQVPHYI